MSVDYYRGAGTVGPVKGAGHRRFLSPSAPVHTVRPKGPGLGQDESEDIPQEPGTSPEGSAEFFGIRSSRGSRFRSPVFPPPQGHGYASAGNPVGPDTGRDDDYLENRWPPDAARPIPGEVPYRLERAGSLGSDDVVLVKIGALRFVRRRSREDTIPGGGIGGVPADPIRWSAWPAPVSLVNRRYTLRPEFMQRAQVFLGLRGYATKGARSSTAPVSMLPPRTNRLTERTLPASFGSTTALNGEG